MWQAGVSWFVGQDVERGEGRPDETASRTWVPLTLYICRPLCLRGRHPSPPRRRMEASPGAAYTSFNEKSVSASSGPFHFFFQAGQSLCSSRLCDMMSSRFCLPILLFWFCSIIYFSSFFSCSPKEQSVRKKHYRWKKAFLHEKQLSFFFFFLWEHSCSSNRHESSLLRLEEVWEELRLIIRHSYIFLNMNMFIYLYCCQKMAMTTTKSDIFDWMNKLYTLNLRYLKEIYSGKMLNLGIIEENIFCTANIRPEFCGSRSRGSVVIYKGPLLPKVPPEECRDIPRPERICNHFCCFSFSAEAPGYRSDSPVAALACPLPVHHLQGWP